MKFEWKKVPIESLCTGIYDGPHATPPKSDSGAVFLGISNFSNGRLDLSNIRYISEDDLPRWTKRVTPKAHDIVFSYEATLNLYAIIPEEFYGCLGRRMALMRPDESKVDYRFLYYYMYSSQWREEIERHKVNGSTVDRIPLVSFPYFTVNLPNMATQKYIAEILSALDKKIELNNKINKNLLEQMQLLYQGLLTNCDCSLIRLGDIAQKIAMGPFGSNIKVSTFVSEGVPIISGNHLRSVFLEEPSYNFITEEHAQKLKNSIVYPRDIIFTHAGNIGQVAMIPNGCDYPYYMISQRQFYMRCDETKVVPELVLFFFHSREGKGKLLANANSTGVPSIAQPSTHLKNMEMPLPNKKDQDAWYKVIRPMVNKYVALCQENKRLTVLRDSLLPRLMSGEIDVEGVRI